MASGLRHGVCVTFTALALALAIAPAGVARAAGPGSLDTGFSGGVVSLGANSQLFGVAVRADGEVLAAGQTGGSVLLERFTAAGQAVASIGPSGVARAVALQPDGRIVVAGASGGMFAERFNPDGTVDRSFGSGGRAGAPALGASGIANAVATGPDHKIVLAGSVNTANGRIALARFNPNGSPDPSFGSGGTEILDLGLPYAAAEGVAVGGDGKIVLVGHEQGSPNYAFYNGLVIRLNPNGSLDPSFAGSGVLSYHKSGGGYDSLNAVALQNDGKIVVGGSDLENNPYALFLRVNSDGTLDPSFGSGGVATLSAGSFTENPVGANGVAIAGGARIVGAGATQQNGTDFRAGLWALTPGGSADPQFGGGTGVVEQQTGTEACALAVAPDGGLVIVGNTVSAFGSNNPPCSVNDGTGGFAPTGFAARYIGYGPPPPPVAPPPPGPPPVRTAAPSATTAGAARITEVSAQASGKVNPNGLTSAYHFDFGQTTKYGSSTGTVTLASASSAVGVSTSLTRLRPRTTYHYRLVASNSDGISYGADRTFKTLPPLTASLRGLARSYSISAVAHRGLAVKVGCSQACSIRGSLLLSADTAKQLGLGRHRRAIASSTGTLTRAASVRLRLSFSRAAKRALAHRRTLTVTLRIVAAPRGGGRAVTFTRALAFSG